VSVEDDSDVAAFQYDPGFLRSGIQVAPLTMPLRREPYAFPGLNRETFKGLPGLLADSLPDRFGNAVIDSWLASQGRNPDSFNAVERLCYVGTRGMGALEFAPQHGPRSKRSKDLKVDALVRLASEILSERQALIASLKKGHEEAAMRDILSVSTSAGGARAKAVIAFNPATNQVRSGQVQAGPGFEYWILKFDGVKGNKDRELEDPQGYCAVEYAYWLMARRAGIQMSECRLLEENDRRHFMTKRFDRLDDGSKIHMQSLGAIAHFDFNQRGVNSYEQAFLAMRRLDLGPDAVEQQFRRMVFNVVARNQDDHVKNIAYLMGRDGTWSLAPAFDVTYSYNPSGPWTKEHQMSINGKFSNFDIDDFRACGRIAALKRGQAEAIVAEVQDVVRDWRTFAKSAGVDDLTADRIQRAHELHFVRRGGRSNTRATRPRTPTAPPDSASTTGSR